jgi:glyoxylase-like metal-dependent hydrolase (beta-lactamase superfamily II)
MSTEGYRNEVRPLEPGLIGIGIEPPFAVGHRALLVRAQAGNVLWDPLSFMDEEAVDQIYTLGGIEAISASHPHFYSSMVEWSHTFDNAPIFLPRADRMWVMRPDPAIHFYDGSLLLFPGVTLIQCGGHFPGSSVLHWAEGAGGQGVLLTGDTIMAAQGGRYVSFMRRFPNLMPLHPSALERIVESVQPYRFDRLHGGWWDNTVAAGAKETLERAAERYMRAVRRYGRRRRGTDRIPQVWAAQPRK